MIQVAGLAVLGPQFVAALESSTAWVGAQLAALATILGAFGLRRERHTERASAELVARL